MYLLSILNDTSLAEAQVVAGRSGLTREIKWVQIFDHPDISEWVKPGHLLLMTGYHWPTTLPVQQALIRKLHQQGLAGIVLAVPRFLTHFPSGVRRVADSIGLPLLEIPWKVPFSQLTEEIHGRILVHQHELLAQSNEIHRVLTRIAASNYSLSAMVRMVADKLACQISLVRNGGLLLATSNAAPQRGKIEADYFCAWVTQHTGADRLDGEAFITPALNDPLSLPRLGCGVLVDASPRAIIWLDRTEPHYTELDQRVIEHMATVVALHLVKAENIDVPEGRPKFVSLGPLLEGHPMIDDVVLERARLAGWDDRESYRVAALQLKSVDAVEEPLQTRLEYWKRHLLRLLIDCSAPQLLSFTSSQLFFLLPDSVSGHDFWRQLGPDDLLAMVVSSKANGVRQVIAAGYDVRELLPHLVWGEVVTADELLVPRALSGDHAARQIFIEQHIGPVLRHQGGTQLLPTLVALSEVGFQLNKAAASLGVHINTLRYRFLRIQELLVGDFDDARFRFEIQLALELWRTHEILEKGSQGIPVQPDNP